MIHTLPNPPMIEYFKDADKEKAKIRTEYLFYLKVLRTIYNKPKIVHEVKVILGKLYMRYHGVMQEPEPPRTGANTDRRNIIAK